MKHYFYIIHDFFKDYDSLTKRYNFDYLNLVESAMKDRNWLLLEKANDVNDYIEKKREHYLLDNRQDVREMRFTGEIKVITEEGYDRILFDDNEILERMSQKSKDLLTEFGFNFNGWHRPFYVECEPSQLMDALILKLNFEPIILE